MREALQLNGPGLLQFAHSQIQEFDCVLLSHSVELLFIIVLGTVGSLCIKRAYVTCFFPRRMLDVDLLASPLNAQCDPGIKLRGESRTPLCDVGHSTVGPSSARVGLD